MKHILHPRQQDCGYNFSSTGLTLCGKIVPVNDIYSARPTCPQCQTERQRRLRQLKKYDDVAS